PFLTRLMQDYNQLKFNIANILSFDYLGALIATISFPFILLPFFGVYQSSLMFGLVNMSIGFVILWIFQHEIGQEKTKFKVITILLTSLLIAMIIFSGWALQHWNMNLYKDRVVYSEQSRYQKIILTKHKNDIRLFLDGNLQFSSIDEYRYHESLIHVPLAIHKKPIQRVLLLGAGDGLAVRELLKYPSITEIIMVDLDKKIIEMAKENIHVRRLNQNSLASDKVKIVISDAFTYLDNNEKMFDFIISDLPDPNNNNLARLYSKQFYDLIRYNLSEDGIFVTQATSPYFATNAFWSINKTIEASSFAYTLPYHVQIPSFGDWGFIIASSNKQDITKPDLQISTKFLDKNNYAGLFIFEKDIKPTTENIGINHIDQPVLLNYYLKGWKYYAR
ncbi:MAG: spermidine synthase, partial [Pseudomonadota bacterium]